MPKSKKILVIHRVSKADIKISSTLDNASTKKGGWLRYEIESIQEHFWVEVYFAADAEDVALFICHVAIAIQHINLRMIP